MASFYPRTNLMGLDYNICMIELNIPGRTRMQLVHLVCDVNGTLAVDGRLLESIGRSLSRLADRLTIHLVTADTQGKQAEIDRLLGLTAVRLQPGNEPAQKAEYIRSLGAKSVVAIGQGANDALMLKEAALGIAILSREGTAVSALQAADILVPDIQTAFELLEKPLRILATLRA